MAGAEQCVLSYGAVSPIWAVRCGLTLEFLGRRWRWEKTKVWRFFRKHADAFPLYKLPGSFGCLVFNAAYPTGERIPQPAMDQIERILSEIRILGRNARNKTSSDHAQLCKLVAWYSRTICSRSRQKLAKHQRWRAVLHIRTVIIRVRIFLRVRF